MTSEIPISPQGVLDHIFSSDVSVRDTLPDRNALNSSLQAVYSSVAEISTSPPLSWSALLGRTQPAALHERPYDDLVPTEQLVQTHTPTSPLRYSDNGSPNHSTQLYNPFIKSHAATSKSHDTVTRSCDAPTDYSSLSHGSATQFGPPQSINQTKQIVQRLDFTIDVPKTKPVPCSTTPASAEKESSVCSSRPKDSLLKSFHIPLVDCSSSLAIASMKVSSSQVEGLKVPSFARKQMKRPHGRHRSHTLGPDGLNTIRLKAESNTSDSNTQGEQSMEMPSSLKEVSESSSIVTDCSSDVVGLDDCSAVTCPTEMAEMTIWDKAVCSTGSTGSAGTTGLMLSAVSTDLTKKSIDAFTPLHGIVANNSTRILNFAKNRLENQDGEGDGLEPPCLIVTHVPEGEVSRVAEPEVSVPAELEVSRVAEQEVSRVTEQEVIVHAEPEVSRVAELEVSVPVELEVNHVAEPEVSFPAVPEVSVPAEPEASRMAEPEVSHVAEPEVSVPAESEVSRVAEPEVSVPAEPEVSRVAEPEVSVPAEPEVSRVAEQEVSRVAEQEVSVPAEPEVSHMAEREVSHVAEPEVSVPVESEVSRVAEPEDSVPAEPEASLMAEPEVSRMAEPEVSVPAELEVSRMAEQEVSVPAELEVSRVAEPEVSVPAEPEVSRVAEPEVSDPAEPETSRMVEPEVSHVAEPEVSVPAEPEVSHVAEQEVSDPAEPEVSYVAEQEVSHVVEQEVSDPAEMEVSHMTEQKSGQYTTSGHICGPELPIAQNITDSGTDSSRPAEEHDLTIVRTEGVDVLKILALNYCSNGYDIEEESMHYLEADTAKLQEQCNYEL